MKTRNPIEVFCTLVALIAVALLTGCASPQWDIGADSRQRNDALSTSKVEYAQVLQVRWVKIAPPQNQQYAGASIGAALGAAAGSKVGNNRGSYIASMIGGVVGGIVGNAVGGAVGGTVAQEVVVRTNDGRVLSVTQSQSRLAVGQQVVLITTNGRVRVTPHV